MNFKLKYGLPFTNVVLTHKGKSLSSDNFLIDTGSASTIIAADIDRIMGMDYLVKSKMVIDLKNMILV